MLREVSREGSLSAAARSLGYTQPAVSHHIDADDDAQTVIVNHARSPQD